jgi:uncharacterized protein (TIGR00251 family)
MPLSLAKGAAALKVKVIPGAGRNEISGIEMHGPHGACVKVRVTAAPEKGKANKEVIKLIARAVGLPATSISVVVGETSRTKVLRFAGDPQEHMAHLQTWLETLTNE